MYRLLLGLGSLVLVAIWGGVALVHAVPPDVVSITVAGVITEATGASQTVSLTVTNNTTDFRMKGFAVTVGTAILGSATADPIWEATATNTKPTGLEELEGSGGARLDLREYVFYQAFVAGDYLPPHGSDNSFTFKRFVLWPRR